MTDPWKVFEPRWSSWETGNETVCGYGSMWLHAKAFAQWLGNLLPLLEIHTVNDAGCGDFNWMKRVNLNGIDYLGYDLVQPENPVLPFQKLNIAQEVMRPADLIICRDVLFHFPNNEVEKTLALFRRSSRFLIATSSNGVPAMRHEWSPNLLQNFSPLDLRPYLGEPLTYLEERQFDRIVGLYSI